MDPQRNALMIKVEEKSRQRFEKLKRTLPAQSSRCWRNDFIDYADQFIKWCLDQKEIITLTPCVDKEDEEDVSMCLHGLKHLVVGAIQKQELVKQPNHAAMCAKLDSVLVWQGRGYVSQILHAI